ncbi:MAG: IS3 family transposase [Micromonospora sp.]
MTVAGFVAAQRTEHAVPHAVTCRALGLSQSWFYKWRDRQPTTRQTRRDALDEAIRACFDASGGTYGSPRVTQDLHADGWQVSVNTVAARMAALGLAGRIPRRRRSLTKQGRRPVAPDRVRRQFTAVAPDVLWCGDITEVVTDEGKLYLATVIDLYSRRLLGYAMSAHHDADLTQATLSMAAATRGGTVDGVIFHSDHGGQGNTPPPTTPKPAAASVSCSPWAGSAAPWTTPPRRHSTPPSRSNTSTGNGSAPDPRPDSRSPPGSSTSTTSADATAPATACHPSTTNTVKPRV